MGNKDARIVHFVDKACHATNVDRRMENAGDDEVLSWVCNTQTAAIIKYREDKIRSIETLATTKRNNGEMTNWYKHACKGARDMSEKPNGPLFEILLKAIDHDDKAVVDIFRNGCQLMGTLESPEPNDACNLKASCLQRNNKLLATVKVDQMAEHLLASTVKDAALGRMGSKMP